MNFFQILLLGIVQGTAELLPVSSSAHVIVAEKLLGLDPSKPEMTFMLVMLHTGTMFAVIAYFWHAWRERYFSSAAAFQRVVFLVVTATGLTGMIGLAIKHLIEKAFLGKGDIEELFSNLPLIGTALAAGGLLIICTGKPSRRDHLDQELGWRSACWIGAVQGLCLPFRGFSRSGATISTGLLRGINKARMEEFSFALAVVLTPPVIGRELLRLLKAHADAVHPLHLLPLLGPGVAGMACSFGAGLLALKFLSRLLETGRWTFFGYYCLVAAAGVFVLAYAGG
ncbi:MAG: undecaprenyl-diphosphate phosphatase [Acidobacteriota bacterium]